MGRAVATWLALVLLAIGVAACGEQEGTPATTTSANTVTTADTTSCAAFGAAGELTSDVGQIDGFSRRSLVHVPASASAAAEPVPALIALHGYSGTPEDFLSWSRLDRAADKAGFVLLTPEGWAAQWNFPGYVYGDGDYEHADLLFLDDLVERLARLDCVDPERIFVTGISMGGGMAEYFACRSADTLAGAVLVAAEHLELPCRPRRPIPIVSLHALDDSILTYGGGSIQGSTMMQLPVEDVVGAWAEHNGCTGGRRSKQLPRGVTRMSWRGCEAPVVHYRLQKGEHDWFRPQMKHAIHTTELIATFATTGAIAP